MTTRIISIIILTFFFFSTAGQTKRQQKKLNRQVERALKEWFKNPSMSNETLDPKIIEQFSDSGRIEMSLKEGNWIEFSLDTFLIGQKATLEIGDKKMPFNFSANLQKETGKYFGGKREGLWTLYNSYDKKPPFSFARKSTTNYTNGKKNGEEILYQGFGEYQQPLLVRNYSNDIENGIGKIYNHHSPHNIQQIYISNMGVNKLLETYYPAGNIQFKMIDTTTNGVKVKLVKEFYEKGRLKGVSYYINDSIAEGAWTAYYENGNTESITNYSNRKLNGIYKYFFDNGQLWTECIYKNGLLWNVISNFDKKGNEKDPGTIKDGNGIRNIYDLDGNLKQTVEYINGIEKN